MLIPRNTTHTKEYSLKSDTDELKTVFTLSPLSTRVKMYLDDIHIKPVRTVDAEGNEGYEHQKVAPYFELIDLVRFGLKSWRNFQIDGKEIAMKLIEKELPGLGKMTIVSDESLDQLEPITIGELAAEIRIMSLLLDTERKN